MAEYTLPDLDYDYGALEPHISGQINQLHHAKHHATYVANANAAHPSRRRLPNETSGLFQARSSTSIQLPTHTTG